MDGRYKDFPPGWGHLRIPTSSRRAALAALAMHSPCKRRGVYFQRAAWIVSSLLGPKALLGREAPWNPPMEEGLWAELT